MGNGGHKKVSGRQLVTGGVSTILTSSTITGVAFRKTAKLYWFYDDVSTAQMHVDRATWLQKHRARVYRRSNDLGDVMSKRYAYYQEVLKRYTKGATLHSGKVSLKMLDLADNGYVVPFKASILEKPENVEMLLVFAPFNKIPEVGRFHFTGLSGHAVIRSRMRLAATQEVVAVVKMKNG